MLTHWHHKRDTWRKEGGASRNTYMAWVIKNKLEELSRDETALLRRANASASPFSKPIDENQTIGDLADVVASSRDRFSSPELAGLLAVAQSRLTPRQARIADLLMGKAMKTEIAAELDVNRDTIYADLKRIRKVYSDLKLEEFLL